MKACGLSQLTTSHHSIDKYNPNSHLILICHELGPGKCLPKFKKKTSGKRLEPW